MDSRSQRDLIDRIRREKFGIGATKSNPLAGMLHEAIVSLSAELYHKDFHFISELLQNAEDNVYAKGVTPSLEFILTKTDITGVGAPATLILFNNEVGFQPEHVEALCAVGMSTKKGKRNSGYIGEKGIGFKSVFLVTRTPYVISNGYRFRFTDEASNKAKIGYVVPEWIEEPTDADLKRVYGESKLPQTMIILPLRQDKVEPVREQLKQVAPETLLFLSKLRQVNVRQDSDSNSLCIIRADIVPPTNGVSTVNLSVGSHANHTQEESKYFLLQQKFQVTQSVEQRKEVESSIITIAFPLRNRINPGQLIGDIFAFLPSDLASGFPFVVNADFLLVSSRETLKFDSPWNIGILSCIPAVFRIAFNFFLQKTGHATCGAKMAAPVLAIRDAYKFVPVITPQQPELRKVQVRIINDLKADDCVLVDALACGDQFCKPEQARFITTEFRKILVDANDERHFSFKSSPAIRNSPWRIVDGEIEKAHAPALKILGVTDMTQEEYIEYLKHGAWILSLSEKLYWDVVSFVLGFCHYNSSALMKAVPILKYCKEDGSIALASFQQAKDKDVEIYTSPSEQGKRLNAEWTSVFKPWVSVVFMPTSTVETLKHLRQQGSHNICYISHYLDTVVSELSVKSYLQSLLALLETAKDPKFVLLWTEFMYQCLQRKEIEKKDCLLDRITVVDQYSSVCKPNHHSSNILLPAHGSTWTKLSLNSWGSCTYTTVLSDDYVITPSVWSAKLKACISNKADPFVFHSYRSYLEDVFCASDIPHMVPQFNSAYQMPNHLRLTMTIEQARLLLKWLTNYLDSQSAFDVSNSRFIKIMKDTEWLPTEKHGLRRPSMCFDRSLFGALFESSDVPCIHHSLCFSSPTLQSLGVVTDNKKGCEAVINYMLEMSNDSTGKHSCNIEQATRLYRYIHKFQLQSNSLLTSSLQKLKIFVPHTSQYNTSNPWKDRGFCVIQGIDDYFGNMLTVLEGLYPLDLLPFFSQDLHVPNQATVEKYCQLWLTWRANVHEITVGECTRVWKELSEKWTKCNSDIRVDFVSKAWVPSMSEITGNFQLSSPTNCFIPDNLHLQSLFAGQPGVHFVWYPDNTEKMESGMNRVYADMKVKYLSLRVQQEFIIGENSAGDHFFHNQRAVAGQGILCPGLFRAILGFLARKKYGLLSSERQRILTSLKSVVEITITRPLTSSWTISSLSPPVVATEDNVMALWSTKDRKFYCLDKENPILRKSLARRHFRTQVATAISCGLLSEHPSVADELTEFIIVLICSGFETSHVEYELRRKNAKLFEEDELFLSQLQS